MSKQKEIPWKALHPSRLASGTLMRWVFSTSALFTIVALGLIIIFLLKESFGFFGQYNESLSTYRESGMELTDMMKARHREYVDINHGLTSLRSDWILWLREQELDSKSVSETLMQTEIDQLLTGYRARIQPLRTFIDQKINLAINNREQLVTGGDLEADAKAILQLNEDFAVYRSLLESTNQATHQLFSDAAMFKFEVTALDRRVKKLWEKNQRLVASTEVHMEELRNWDPDKPVGRYAAIRSFLAGTKWISASDQQNWFGLLPLFTGSMLVCGIALVIATPVGIGAAVYANQVASPRELALIKPFIEFISAIPAVVIGFFGVMVLGDLVREILHFEIFQWLPFFPIQERLNAFTAGTLLGLMAVPTIFTLTEEALNDVPQHLREASYAIGATQLQTTWRTIIPSAFPGIVSAVMLGFGRVIGETMVVLLCAGNRVKIPEFEGIIQPLFEPVHTMTGMIAQEMGEVINGSPHYHALFMVGVVLFILSLTVNFTAKSLAVRNERYRQSG